MKIMICASMVFAKNIISAKDQLEKLGHVALVPEPSLIGMFIDNPRLHDELVEKGEHRRFKRKYDLIRKNYQQIVESDAILVLNLDHPKKNIKGYVGANTFLEMGFAHILNKPIYLFNSLPESSPYIEEMSSMKTIVLNGDLSKI